ncbi:hypothetical protein P8452_51008 [Trifolium repens]|nr:hypothetical protein P8452_16554 [Trifolium repens]WJX33336.1 hypothetical protein P8452_21551 [Trifolium repens]WJX57094.1 hypothetical protein P8452_42688 [Trifolium repens]WJX66451.1 hypothetical protein P8452_51008 [Trifolium repens]
MDHCNGEESQKATSTAKLGGGDDVELQNGMTVSVVTADGSLKVHLIQSLAVLMEFAIFHSTKLGLPYLT